MGMGESRKRWHLVSGRISGIMDYPGESRLIGFHRSPVKIRAALMGFLLALALVVCHAASEGTDRLVLEPLPVVAAHQLPEGTGFSPGHQTEHFSSHAYDIAALVTGLLGSFLWLFFRIFKKVSRKRQFGITSQLAQRHSAAEIIPRKYSYSLTFLQVFRQ
jgi:hypothetical protein